MLWNHPSAAQGGAAQVLRPLAWDLRDRGEEELAEPRVVLLEDADDGLGRDGLLALHADVMVGDRRHVRVAELELAREVALGVGGHVDHLAERRVPARLGAGREAWALD